MNWRKPFLHIAFNLSGRPVFKYFKYLRSLEYESLERLTKLQDENLEKLLLHAYNNVPYYNKILAESEVIKNNSVLLENFQNIPVLTKDIIRSEGHNLYSKDHKQRNSYKNTSGGSTGEPVQFLQDKHYQDWGLAGRFLFNFWLGKDIGQAEIKLWGSDRDILGDKEKMSVIFRRWLFNTIYLNTYKMSKDDMRSHISRWNHFKPKQVWAYTDSMYHLSRFVAEEGLNVHSPSSIICTTAKLLPKMRSQIQKTFRCGVYDQYGSREVGTIASECRQQKGLHIFNVIQKLEILDNNDVPVQGENIGKIVVTNLHNYSMPLIRYRIEDTGCYSADTCPCGRGFPLLKEVSGRVFAHFLRQDGGVVHSQFFVALFFFKPWVGEFKVIQKDYDLIQILIAKKGEPNPDDINVITSKIHQVMGANCRVDFKFVDEVPPTSSGKYVYTFSEISR